LNRSAIRSASQSKTALEPSGTKTNCPAPLQGNIQKALSKGQISGTIAAAVRLWQWHALLAPTVTIELTRDDVVVQAIEIATTGWAAFPLCADRRGIDARSWLSFILSDGLSREVSIEEWLFPSKSAPEIQRFDSMQRGFHATVEATG
jgi:hypothetical protein